MNRVKGIACLIFLFGGAGLWAGDIAEYVNLGFSPDSSYFLFGYYGINKKSQPYAETFLVDVKNNDFAADGVCRRTFDRSLQPGQTGSGAMYKTLLDQADVISRYGIDPTAPGRMMYLLLNGDEPKESLEFRDFKNQIKYKVALHQTVRENGEEVEASFYISLDRVNLAGDKSTFTLGLKNYFREGVREYRIKQVLFSPDEASLVFVVEKWLDSESGHDIRYMVETVKL